MLVHGVTDSSRAWWRVGPWFAEAGWRAVAPDLRGHGGSPRMRGGGGLEDLAEDVFETLDGLAAPGRRADVLLGHSLGAPTALKLCEKRGDVVGRLVLVDPPGSGSTDFGEVTRDVQAQTDRAREAPGEAVRGLLAENPSWAEEDARNEVAGHRECDAAAVAAMVEGGLRYDLAAIVGAVGAPTLLVLGVQRRDRPCPSPNARPSSGR